MVEVIDKCVICAEDFKTDDASPTFTLECGHLFHCICAVQWFRYNHACCPLCRATHVEAAWHMKTPAQRVNLMHRAMSSLSPMARRKLKLYDRVKKRHAERTKALREFKIEHGDLLKHQRKLSNLVNRDLFCIKKLVRQLAWSGSGEVPHLYPYPEPSI